MKYRAKYLEKGHKWDGSKRSELLKTISASVSNTQFYPEIEKVKIIRTTR